MIRHIVLLAPRAGAEPALTDILQGLAKLVGQIPGFTGFEHGPNRDFENLSPGYSHGFICDFTDQAALQTYAADPRHQALGQRLVTACTPNGIMVIDLDLA